MIYKKVRKDVYFVCMYFVSNGHIVDGKFTTHFNSAALEQLVPSSRADAELAVPKLQWMVSSAQKTLHISIWL